MTPHDPQSVAPLTPSVDGRDAHGRFAPGNKGGPGNPHNRTALAIRRELLAAVTEDDIRQVARVLTEKAKAGNIAAIRELLDRLLGKPTLSIEGGGSDGERPALLDVFLAARPGSLAATLSAEPVVDTEPESPA